MIPQFVGAFLFASVVMIGGSLAWPLIMKQERPPLLQAVRDRVVETDIGRNAENVLGAYTVPTDVPQAVSSVSSQVISQVGVVVQKKIEDVVTERVIEEMVKRFDTLSPSDKEGVKTVICKPAQ